MRENRKRRKRKRTGSKERCKIKKKEALAQQKILAQIKKKKVGTNGNKTNRKKRNVICQKKIKLVTSSSDKIL